MVCIQPCWGIDQISAVTPDDRITTSKLPSQQGHCQKVVWRREGSGDQGWPTLATNNICGNTPTSSIQFPPEFSGYFRDYWGGFGRGGFGGLGWFKSYVLYNLKYIFFSTTFVIKILIFKLGKSIFLVFVVIKLKGRAELSQCRPHACNPQPQLLIAARRDRAALR